MAITTKTELEAAAANWLVRSDLTTRIPEFLALAEARINRLLRYRLAETDASVTATVGARVIALPSAFAEAMNLWIVRDSGRDALEFVDAALLESTTDNAEPRFWTIDGSNLAFDCPCAEAYSFTLRYLAKFTLTDAAPTNALLTNAPDVYLFALLSEAAPFLRDAELAGAYEARLGQAIRDLNAQSHRNRRFQTLRSEVALLPMERSGYNINTDS
jgi:hypothetical protein